MQTGRGKNETVRACDLRSGDETCGVETRRWERKWDVWSDDVWSGEREKVSAYDPWTERTMLGAVGPHVFPVVAWTLPRTDAHLR